MNCKTCGPEGCSDRVACPREYETEAQYKLIERQGEILRAVVNAVRGAHPDGGRWSTHDAAELVLAVVAERDAALADACRAYDKLNGLHISARAHRDRVRELTAERDALRAELAAPRAQEPVAPGPLKVGNLPTLSREAYPGLGDWWVQIWHGDQVVGRAYGDTPHAAHEMAVKLAGNAAPQPAAAPAKFRLGDRVRKTRGREWQGRIVGTYSTSLTSEGYVVESEVYRGSVHITLASALVLMEGGAV